ncbi:MAG: pyroglutamyl-peptidase I [Clostridia bacterium]|nr:pyroglutamyl-peptidase I [Clostridia bacterium]
MKKLLITGFEPFGGEAINPSWEALVRLPEKINEYNLTRLRLPVTFGMAAEMVIKTAEEIGADVILCVGQAGGRSAITPELVGINLRHATTPDDKGYQPQDEPIIVGGATAYFSTLPVRSIVEAMRASDVPAQVSYSAGAYVCNDVLYTVLAHFQDSEVKAGFIHVPYSDDQNKEPSMAIEQIVKGLRVAIEAI